MKRTLYSQISFTLLLFGIACFLLVAVLISKLFLYQLTEKEGERLYAEGKSIASSLGSEDIEGSPLDGSLSFALSHISQYMNAPIWLLTPDGDIRYVFSDAGISSPNKRLKDFQADDFDEEHFQTGDFYGCFSKEYLSACAPIQDGQTLKGYVLVHRALGDFYSFHNELLNISYFSFLISVVLAVALFIVFTIFVYHPIRILSVGATEYAKGNYDHTIAVTPSNNELGYIAASLNYMADKLKTTESKQRSFISNVSHDFRSPLTSIRGYVNAMLDGTIPVEAQKKYLEIILFEAERLEKLTESLLELNKYEEKSYALELTPFPINDVIQKTVDTFEGICRGKRLDIQTHFPSGTIRVYADLGKIQQVLYNLIDNAIKFSHADSTIEIEAKARNGKAYISVRDHGIGIPRDSIGKIWERFYKTDTSRGRDKRGTGLGLSIVREIILAHGENINVISTEGVGTEFIFTLSLADRA